MQVRLTREADRSWELAERLGRSAGVNLEWEPVKPPPSVSGRGAGSRTVMSSDPAGLGIFGPAAEPPAGCVRGPSWHRRTDLHKRLYIPTGRSHPTGAPGAVGPVCSRQVLYGGVGRSPSSGILMNTNLSRILDFGLMQRVHVCMVYTFQLNLHCVQQKVKCHLNLGNLMDVQERHITNRKCRDIEVEGGWSSVNVASQHIREGRVDLPFFQGEMTQQDSAPTPTLPILNILPLSTPAQRRNRCVVSGRLKTSSLKGMQSFHRRSLDLLSPSSGSTQGSLLCIICASAAQLSLLVHAVFSSVVFNMLGRLWSPEDVRIS
ncbi:hypothetical protein J6590_049413 [Homalodisca vitripennis]|nr:hypothetical protein J6590_049413 [Homalodisca vitripennis]